MIGVLQVICNIIILIGAVIGALFTISKFGGANFNFFKKKHKKQFEKDLQEILPKYLEEYFKNLDDKLEEIKKIDLEQSKSIDNIIRAEKDILRYQIMGIYQKYKKTRKLPLYEREKLDETYSDYKALDGNNYIDKYYTRMTQWEVIYFIDEENEKEKEI